MGKFRARSKKGKGSRGRTKTGQRTRKQAAVQTREATERHRPPAWANASHYTALAARSVAAVGYAVDGEHEHPHTVAKVREMIGWRSDDWTISRARSATTEEIVQQLATEGVTVTPATFAAMSADHVSAWAVSEDWHAPNASAQTLGVCACELWRRWRPEPPSLEMIDDLFQHGYAHAEEADLRSASERFLEGWEQLCDRLPSSVESLKQASKMGFLQHLPNALYDTLDIVGAGYRGDSERISRALAIYGRLRDRFPDEHRPISAEVGLLLDRLGRRDEAEAEFVRLMEEDPDDPMPYANLADLLGYGDERDVPRAIALLEEAIARPVRDQKYWDLDVRLQDLREGGA